MHALTKTDLVLIARFSSRSHPVPKPGKKLETYEWAITSDEDAKHLARAMEERGERHEELANVHVDAPPGGMLRIPDKATYAAESVFSSFPPVLRETADKAILQNFPNPTPGWYGKVPNADPISRVTELDTKVVRATASRPVDVNPDDED
jgi:hypothetical protein